MENKLRAKSITLVHNIVVGNTLQEDVYRLIDYYDYIDDKLFIQHKSGNTTFVFMQTVVSIQIEKADE